MNIEPIAYARNGFAQKFGIPRQSRDHSALLTRIVFQPEYRVRDALRGIEGFSHLWLIWGFSANHPTIHWSPTVRPPRLGGNTRMGVFATRSPYRPNPIGLTSVRLERIEEHPSDGWTLVVSGADLLDGTPIYDIKPYLPYSDAHTNATGGFTDQPNDYHLPVRWTPEADAVLRRLERQRPHYPLRQALEEILSENPRPAYHDDADRLYGLTYDGVEVKFHVYPEEICVVQLFSAK